MTPATPGRLEELVAIAGEWGDAYCLWLDGAWLIAERRDTRAQVGRGTAAELAQAIQEDLSGGPESGWCCRTGRCSPLTVPQP